MKNVMNILLLILSLCSVLFGIALVPAAGYTQNIVFAVMVLLIIGLFGIIRFIARKRAL